MTGAAARVAAFLALAAIPLSLVASAGRLPDPLATRWGFDGVPNSAMSPFAYGIVITSVGVLIAVIFLVLEAGRLNLLTTSRELGHRGNVVAGCATVGLLVTIHTGVLVANAGIDDWHESRLSMWWLVAALAVAGLAGLLGGAVAKDR